MAGRQIVTAEKLEVLALGTDLDIDDGRPIREVLSLVTENGGLPVIPWGAGKWWETTVAAPASGPTLPYYANAQGEASGFCPVATLCHLPTKPSGPAVSPAGRRGCRTALDRHHKHAERSRRACRTLWASLGIGPFSQEPIGPPATEVVGLTNLP